MSVMGYCLADYYPGRGPIEATSRGIDLRQNDIALRCNLITLENGKIKDYSAGHIDNSVSTGLMNALQDKFGNDRITFYPGVSYRNLIVLHGREFSDKLDYAKPDSSHGMNTADIPLRPLDSSPEAEHTADFLNKLVDETAPFLAGHPLNSGKSAPANSIWPWSPGRKPAMPSFPSKYNGKTAAAISAVDVITGLGRCMGMDIINVPGATGYIDTNYAGKAEAAVKALKNHDLVYLHVEAIDECGHEGNLELKMKAIEDFDSKIVGPVMNAMDKTDTVFAVLPDHPVPIKLRKHTRTPVPVAICGPHISPDGVRSYTEKSSIGGALGLMREDEFIKLVLNIR
jgi:2,3-bisphosphoglycerate-independent phosphoglycerate mutase